MIISELISESIPLALLVTGCGYTIIIVILAIAIGRVKTGAYDEYPVVNVVVAARNEEVYIANCLSALRIQDYPQKKYQVIVVNDRSTDSTGAILAEYSNKWDALSVISVNHVPEGVSPKKHALELAIGKAQGEIILQTDADCAVPTTWISGMVRRFEPGINMVVGVAPYRPENGIIARFVAHEYIWNVLLSAGSIALGAGTHASGRNLAFRRAAFMDVEGYGSSRFILSGDDTLLMQRFQRRSPESVATNPLSTTHVLTDPPKTFTTFVRQRIRHMSTGRYFHPFQIAAGVILYGFHVAMLISFVLTPILPQLGIIAIFAFLLKIFCDTLVFARAGQIFSLSINWSFFIIGEMLLCLYFSLFPVLGTILPSTWKENR